MSDRISKSNDFNVKAEEKGHKGRKGKTKPKLLTKKRINMMEIYKFCLILQF